jgi:hypothetical protein
MHLIENTFIENLFCCRHCVRYSLTIAAWKIFFSSVKRAQGRGQFSNISQSTYTYLLQGILTPLLSSDLGSPILLAFLLSHNPLKLIVLRSTVWKLTAVCNCLPLEILAPVQLNVRSKCLCCDITWYLFANNRLSSEKCVGNFWVQVVLHLFKLHWGVQKFFWESRIHFSWQSLVFLSLSLYYGLTVGQQTFIVQEKSKCLVLSSVLVCCTEKLNSFQMCLFMLKNTVSDVWVWVIDVEKETGNKGTF